MDFTPESIGTILKIAIGGVGVFALIATLTPNTSDNKWAQKLLDILNVLGANFGGASNNEGGGPTRRAG